jgi:pilus assembly protein Flp/PilA
LPKIRLPWSRFGFDVVLWPWWSGGGRREHIKNATRSFVLNETGATAIEYGLIVALVSVGLVAVLGEVGTRLQEVFANIAQALTPQ